MATKHAREVTKLLQAQDFFGAALKLREIQENWLYFKDGCASFPMFVEKHVGRKQYRKAMNLIRMTKDRERLKYTISQTRKLIKELGVSKTWIGMRHASDDMSAAELLELGKSATNPDLEAFLKGESKQNFTARISYTNYQKLMDVLENHGMVETYRKHRKVGPAFDNFLTRYFKNKKSLA